MKRLIITALFALLAFTVQAQQQIIEDVNIVRVGFWQVVSPDTITNHPTQYQAIERQLNLLLQGIEANQIVIKPPLFEVRPTYGEFASTDTVFITEYDTVFVEEPADTVFVDSPPDTVTVTETDTLLAYETRNLYPVEIDTANAIYYDIHETLRDIDWQVIEEVGNDSTFRVRAFGYTTANRIRYASKCIGYDSTMTAIDNRRGMSLEPDSTGFVDATTTPYTCDPEGGNALMTIWFTAFTDTEEILHRTFIDVAHIRGIPYE